MAGVSLSKGGVGKTTTAVNLSAGLAHAGHTVLLVDCDTQGQAARALGLRPAQRLADVLAGELSPAQAIVEARERLSLLAGGRALAGVKRVIDRRDFGRERVLSESLAPLEGRYQFIILDRAPGWDSVGVNALFFAQEIMVPVAVEPLALQSLVAFTQSLPAIQRHH